MQDVNPVDFLTVTEIEAAPLHFKALIAAMAGDYKTAYEYQCRISDIYEKAFNEVVEENNDLQQSHQG